MWNLKHDTNELIYETETDSYTQRTDLWLPRGRGGGAGWIGSLGLPDANYYIHWVGQKVHSGFSAESLCCMPETNTTL